MLRSLLLLAAFCAPLTAPALANAANKEASCKMQAELVSAVQQARLDQVAKASLTETLMAANPDWPATVASALPALGEYVYGFSRNALRDVDLGAAAQAQCLANWDMLQQLQKGAGN